MQTHRDRALATMNLDLTTMITPEGRKYLKEKGGKGAEELADSYAQPDLGSKRESAESRRATRVRA